MNRELFEYEDDAFLLRDYLDEIRDCCELSSNPLPSPDLIWRRAELAKKRNLARRSVLAIDAVRTASLTVSSASVILLMLLWAPRLFATLPIPVPLTMASLILFAASTGSVLFVWARQR